MRDWSPSEDTRAVEYLLRDRQLFVARDATRPWLWLFTPSTVDKAGASPADLPEVEGYTLQRTFLCMSRVLSFGIDCNQANNLD